MNFDQAMRIGEQRVEGFRKERSALALAGSTRGSGAGVVGRAVASVLRRAASALDGQPMNAPGAGRLAGSRKVGGSQAYVAAR